MKATTVLSSLVTLLLLLGGCAREAPTPQHGSVSAEPVEPELRVAVGEVVASSGGGPSSAEALRGALRELARNLDADERLGRELVFDGAVTSLDRSPSGGGVRVRASVSLSVRDAGGGQILVMLESTTQSTGPVPTSDAEREAFDREVIEGAVQALWQQLEPRLTEL